MDIDALGRFLSVYREYGLPGGTCSRGRAAARDRGVPLAERGAWTFDQDVALTVAINTILSLNLAHTLRHSAQPPDGFQGMDRILAISVVARMIRPK